MSNVGLRSIKRTLAERAYPQPVYRVVVRMFWRLLALEVMLLLVVLGWLLYALLPAQMPLIETGDVAIVRNAVWARLSGVVNDPLIEVQPGISVRESNLRGFNLNDVVYYYYVVGNQNFDPLSRNLVSSDQIEVVLRDDEGPLPLVIYRIRPES